MTRFTKITRTLVVTTMMVLSIALALVYNDRKSALEFAVAAFSDMQLSINGDFSVDFSNWVATIKIQQAQLVNPQLNQPLLTIGKLEAKVEFKQYSLTFNKLQALSIYDLTVHIERFQDGTLNWPETTSNNRKSAPQDYDWDVLVGDIYLENLQILAQGFTDL